MPNQINYAHHEMDPVLMSGNGRWSSSMATRKAWTMPLRLAKPRWWAKKRSTGHSAQSPITSHRMLGLLNHLDQPGKRKPQPGVKPASLPTCIFGQQDGLIPLRRGKSKSRAHSVNAYSALEWTAASKFRGGKAGDDDA